MSHIISEIGDYEFDGGANVNRGALGVALAALIRRENLNRPWETEAPVQTRGAIYVGNWIRHGGGRCRDKGCDGTLMKPYVTIDRALRDIGTNNGSTVTIYLAPGVHDLPPVLADCNWINIQGYEEDGATLTQTGAAVDTSGEKIVVDVTGIETTEADELRGTLFRWTSGNANNLRGHVYASDVTGTTAPGVTRLYVTQDRFNPRKLPGAGSTMVLVNRLSTVRSVAPTGWSVITASVQLNLKSVNVSDDSGGGSDVFFILVTDKVQFEDCYTHVNRFQIGRHGGCLFVNSYLANTGNGTRGVLSVKRGADCQIHFGTVIDCDLNATVDANRFVEIETSTMNYQGASVFIGLCNKGIRMDGSQLGAEETITAHHAWLFVDCDAGFVLNSTGQGNGGWYQTPNLHGEVASDYAVTAKDAAIVKLGSSSALVTATGTNTVSADGGISAVATAHDGTSIEGGAPGNGYEIADPGNGGTLQVSESGEIALTIGAGAETRILPVPSRSGVMLTVHADTVGGGSCAVNGAFGKSNTSATFAAAGDALTLLSVRDGAGYRWTLLADDGPVLA